MRILYISSPSFADCDFPLIREYQRKGIDITYLILLSPYTLRSTLLDIKKQIPKTGIFLATEYEEFQIYKSYMDLDKTYIANRPGRDSLTFSYWKHIIDLYLFVKRGQFDIIHSDVSFVPGMRLLNKLQKNWIQTVHDPFPHSGEESSRKIDYLQNISSRAKFIFLLNKNQKESFSIAYNINPNKIFTNHLGVYDNIKLFTDESQQVRNNNILFFGRISPYKGLEYLCQAMVIVREQIPNATLTIAGGGKMYFNIEPYKKLGYIEVYNHYVGMNDLAKYLYSCELCVCPYTDATQSGVIMTSYSLGKPVIATEVGGLPEMIENGKTGLLVPPKNSQLLARAIIALLKDRRKLESMSSYINEYGTGEKSWSNIADRYIDIYSTLL